MDKHETEHPEKTGNQAFTLENFFPRGFGRNKEASLVPYLFSSRLSGGWSAAGSGVVACSK